MDEKGDYIQLYSKLLLLRKAKIRLNSMRGDEYNQVLHTLEKLFKAKDENKPLKDVLYLSKIGENSKFFKGRINSNISVLFEEDDEGRIIVNDILGSTERIKLESI